MLIKLADHLRPTNALQKTYIGRVLTTDAGETDDNGNTLQIGRIKCSIQGLIEDTSNLANMPWIYPNPNNTMGGANTSGHFAVPLVGSYVNIEFPYDDIYAGFYGGNFTDPNTMIGLFNDGYPNSYGFRDEQNTYWKVNKAQKYAEFHHSSGSGVEFDADGSITLTSHADINLVSEDGLTQLTFDMLNGNIVLSPKNGLTLSGPTVTLSPSQLVVDVDDYSENINGAKDSQIVGAYRQQVGGSMSTVVVGSMAESATGDFNKLIAQQGNYTFGLGKSEDIVLGDNDMKILVGDRNINLLLGNYEIDMILGDYTVDLKAGLISITTVAGSAEIGNELGSLEVGIAGDCTLSNNFGKVSIDPAGAVTASNNFGSLKIDAAGNVTMDATLNMTLKALVEAEISGLTQTILGSASGITMVNGSIVLLGGGGLPVARVGDICIGVGNLGLPVISNIVLGSFKVLSA